MKNELLMIVGWGVIKICRNAKELSNRGKTEGILSKDIFSKGIRIYCSRIASSYSSVCILPYRQVWVFEVM